MRLMIDNQPSSTIIKFHIGSRMKNKKNDALPLFPFQWSHWGNTVNESVSGQAMSTGFKILI